MTTLSNDEAKRYARQIILPEIGAEGQKKLGASRVLILGAGGLGSPVALYLAAAGVGCLGIVDADRVEESNLQRQVLHGTGDLGKFKTESAREAIERINPGVKVCEYRVRFEEANAGELLRGYEIGVGCVDNFDARYALDAECVRQGKAHVFGAVSGFEGQAGVFGGWGGGCYRCFFREGPERGWRAKGVESGILGSVAGVIGCVQACEVVKCLVGFGRGLGGRLLLFDALGMRFREIQVKRDPGCPVCGGMET